VLEKSLIMRINTLSANKKLHEERALLLEDNPDEFSIKEDSEQEYEPKTVDEAIKVHKGLALFRGEEIKSVKEQLVKLQAEAARAVIYSGIKQRAARLRQPPRENNRTWALGNVAGGWGDLTPGPPNDLFELRPVPMSEI